MKCDLANMLRQTRQAIDHERDRWGYAAALEDLEDHVRMVRKGEATLDEFADFYMIRPKAESGK